jgi:Condensation domain
MIEMERELPDLPLFNLPFAFRLQGPLDVEALKLTFDEIVRRHESLRTAFGWSGGEPVSRIVAPADVAPVLSVGRIGSGRAADKRLKALQLRKIKLLAEQEAKIPIDTTRAPLMRARLLRLQADDHVLLLTIHHAIADGWSIGVLFEEISKRYAALTGRHTGPLNDPPPAFSDVARWQRWWCGTDAARRQIADWAESLRGAAPVFHGDDVPPGPPTGYHPVRFDEGLVARLTAFANSQNGTLFMCLLTGLKALLLARTGRTDICVATAMANRTQPDTDRIIGPFENTVIIRTRIEPELSFAQAFSRVRQSVLDAHARQEVPSDVLAERLQNDGIDPAVLTQVYFTLQNPLRQPIDLPDIAVRSIANVAREGQPVLPIDQTWLSLMLKERPTGITGSCNYKRDLLSARTIGGWMDDLLAILAEAIAQPNVPLAHLIDRAAA